MDTTFLISIICLYFICIWVIGFNVLYDNRLSVFAKRIIVVFLFLPPIGVLLFFLFKIKNKNKKPIRKKEKKRKVVYHGGYKGGHNEPKK